MVNRKRLLLVVTLRRQRTWNFAEPVGLGPAKSADDGNVSNGLEGSPVGATVGPGHRRCAWLDSAKMLFLSPMFSS